MSKTIMAMIWAGREFRPVAEASRLRGTFEAFRCYAVAGVVAVAGLSLGARALADESGPVHTDEAEPAQIEGGLTLTYQHARDTRVDDELQGSADLVLVQPWRGGEWAVHAEASTSPREGHVSSLLPEANADAATAVDGDGNGRVQISELNYTHPAWAGALTVGVLNATGVIDASDVANDETSQFLGKALVNNPSIEFPDYAPGLVYEQDSENDRFGFALVVTSSSGLADNRRATYGELFDMDNDKKGVFAAAEARWRGETSTLRLGGWTHTGDHTRLDGKDGVDRNVGAYLSLDRPLGGGVANLRLGAADPAVSRAARFVSLAYTQSVGRVTVGAGAARTYRSDEGRAGGEDDVTQEELYVRIPLGRGLSMSPSVQWLHNSGFDGSGTRVAPRQVLFGLRLERGF